MRSGKTSEQLMGIAALNPSYLDPSHRINVTRPVS